jgi:Na+-transporting methylmalonyl-CoA/oxaloacetate decarboxylase gamma subunit
MAKINTPQIMTMVAIFAVLIGLIIFMRRNDEKEGFSGAAKAIRDAQAKAAKAAKDAKNRNRDAAARAAAAAKKAMKRFR